MRVCLRRNRADGGLVADRIRSVVELQSAERGHVDGHRLNNSETENDLVAENVTDVDDQKTKK